MLTILNRQRYQFNPQATRVWIAMLVVLALCFGATAANAATKPGAVVSRTEVLGDLTSGGFTAQKTPAGGSFAVTPNGKIVVGNTWGNGLDMFDIATGTRTTLAFGNNAGVTSDAQNNLFVGGLYKHKLFKLPYVNGDWVNPNANLDAAPACTGTDTVGCYMPTLTNDYNQNPDIKNTAFDAAGNLYEVSAPANSGTEGGNAIYVLSAANLYTGPPVLIYTDDATHVILSIAIDPWGNLFFTDAVFGDLGNSTVNASSLNVLPYTPGTGYAASKTVLATWTNGSPASYNNVLSGVAIDPADGTVYYSDNNRVIAIPNNPSTAPDIANAYLVTALKGGYQLMPDGKGNLWSVAYDNAGGTQGVIRIRLNNVVVPNSAVGTPSDATVVGMVLTGVDCSTGPLTFTFAGGNAAAASASDNGSCSANSFGDVPVTGAAYGASVVLTPSVTSTNVATMTVADSLANAGRFTITSGPMIGRQSIVTSQSAVLGDLSSGGFTAQKTPAGGSFAVTPNGKVIVGNTWGNGLDVFDIATATRTTLPFGNNAGVMSDGQSNLYVGGLYKHKLFKLPFVGSDWANPNDNLDGAPACTGTDTVGCYMPTLTNDYNQNPDIKNTAFDAAGNLYEVSAPAGSGTAGGNSIYVLPASKLYTGPPVLIYTDDATHVIMSIALDPWGNLFFTDAVFGDLGNSTVNASSLNVLPYSASAGFASTKTVLATWTNPSPTSYNNVLSGVSVDANGAVYYSDNNVTFAIPNNLTTPPNAANAYLVATKGGYQLMPDGKGNLWSVAYDNAASKQGVFSILLDNVLVPAAKVGSVAEATNVVTALSSVDCTATGTVGFTFSGGNATTATGATSGTCSAYSLADATAWAYPTTTIDVIPAVIGANTAVLTATDSASNTATITVTGEGQAAGTTPQEITFNNPGTQSAAVPLNLVATATSGLTVSFLSSTPAVCTIDGARATFSGAGPCTIVAMQSGDDTYAAATPVSQTFAVNLTAQTITFPTIADQMVGTSLALIGAQAPTASSGLPVALASTTTGVCNFKPDGVTLVMLSPGTCTVEATQPGNNLYAAATPAPMTFEVKPPASQTITFNNPGPQGVGFPLILTATSDSGLAVTYSASPSAVCKVTGNTATFLTVGDCTIVASQAGNMNFAPAEPVSQTFAVLAWGTQTITFPNPGSQKVGVSIVLSASTTAPAPLTVTLTSTTPEVCTLGTDNRTANFLATGTCTIVASQAGDLVTWGPAAPITQNITVNGTGWVQFTLRPTVASVNAKAGLPSSAVTINVDTAAGFTSDISFSCSGLPAGATCSFYPATISLPDQTWTTLTINTASTSAALHHSSNPLFPATTVALVGFCLLGSRKRRLQIVGLMVAVVIALVMLSGCGGGSTSKPVQSTVTVIATAGPVQQTTQITLNVTK